MKPGTLPPTSCKKRTLEFLQNKLNSLNKEYQNELCRKNDLKNAKRQIILSMI